MTQINLLPWRQTRRKMRNRMFYGLFGGCIGITFLWMMLAHGVLKMWQHTEVANITYLDAELKEVDDAIKVISNLESEKSQLMKRMEVIHELQHERFSLVCLLDTVVRVMPAGLLLTEFDRALDRIVLQGIADTNASISELLRNLEEIENFTHVKLTEVACHKKQVGLHFKIEFEQIGEE